MRVSPDTTYRNYEGHVYIYQNELGFSCLMNEIAFDLLECVKRAGDMTLERAADALAEIYDVDDRSAFLSDLSDTMRFLADHKILIGDDVRPPHEGESAETLINRVCIKHHILQRVCLELTYRCNERCVHCYVGDEDKSAPHEMPLAVYRKLLDELRAMDVLHITLTGGDVAMRADFLDILEYAIRLGFAVGVYTNGIGFSEETLDKIARLHPRAVSFSLYSGIAEEHDAITGVKGSFQKTLYALMRLKCAGVLTNVKTVAMRPTMGGFDALASLCEQLHVELEVSYLVSATNRGCLKPTELRLGDVEAYKRMMRRHLAGKPLKTPGRRNRCEAICGTGALSLSINPFGDVFPCNGYSRKLGNVLTDSIRSIWEGERLKAVYGLCFSNLDDRCQNCVYQDDCLYCVGAALAENNDEYRKISEACLIARAAYEVRCEQNG